MELKALIPLILLLTISLGATAAEPIGLEVIERFDLMSNLRQGVRAYQYSSHAPDGGGHDCCHYLYYEGIEKVIFDVAGPGCIYRIWFTGHTPSGHIRFYFDGSATPQIDMELDDFFSGTIPPFLAPLVGDNIVSSGGFYCYLPIPFKEGCKITSTSGDHFYNITYHRFSDAEDVTTFTGLEDSSAARDIWENAGTDPKPDHGDTTISATVSIPNHSTLEIANIQSPGTVQQIEFTVPGMYVAEPTTPVTDDGRAFGYNGYCEFDVSIDPNNLGVQLKRRLDYGIGDQKSNVYVDDALVGEWYTPGLGLLQWLDSAFEIPGAFSAGKSTLTVRVEFVSSGYDWNEFYYWVSSFVGGEYVLTDELDVRDSASESSHNYTIVNQTWEGERTFTYYVEIDEDIRTLLTELHLVVYWDGAAEAAVDVPFADFFGCALGPYRVNGLPVGIDDERLYCYFPMPFSDSAVVNVVNSGDMNVDELGYTVRYTALSNPPEGVGSFHAKYNSETPTALGSDYVFLDETGAGHLVGIVQTVEGDSQFYLEGDERFYIDGSLTPSLYGTGTEDFYNGGWYFNQGPFTLPVHGSPAFEGTGGPIITSLYRFFLSDPIPFTTSIFAGIETGATNDVAPNVYSVAFYYKAPEPLAILTDELDVGDVASETNHSYSITDEVWSGSTTDEYEGDHDDVPVTDDGRRFGTVGESEFTVTIEPVNDGVLLRRRMDYSFLHQKAEVYVDDVLAGIWYDPGSNDYHTFRDTELMIPPSLTQGKTSIAIRVENISASHGWTEYRYWIYTLLPAAPPADLDGDGLPDIWEQQIIDDDPYDDIETIEDVLPGDDYDGDDLTNLQEYELETCPVNANTDGDGLDDGDEVAAGTDPLVETYYVDDTVGNNSYDGLLPEISEGHGPKKTIQAGIDADVNRNEVVVAPGTYSGAGNKDLDSGGKAVSLRSSGGPHTTIIDCENTGRAIYCSSVAPPGVLIDGFTITNGNTPGEGGGICCSTSALTVRNCIIANNSSTGDGGGICCKDYSNATITNCLVTGNSSDSKGGGIFCGSSQIEINNLTFTGNSAVNFGGGLMISWGSVGTITNTILWGDSAGDGDEMALKHTIAPSIASVSHCDVEGGESGVDVMSECTLNWGSGNIDSDPLFTTGPLGGCYLSQIAAGQASDSPCVDAGSDTAENLGFNELMTRTDGLFDAGVVDMGYHYPVPYDFLITSIEKTGDNVTIYWNTMAGVSYTVQHSPDMENWTDVPVGEIDHWTDTNATGEKKFYRILEQ